MDVTTYPKDEIELYLLSVVIDLNRIFPPPGNALMALTFPGIGAAGASVQDALDPAAARRPAVDRPHVQPAGRVLDGADVRRRAGFGRVVDA